MLVTKGKDDVQGEKGVRRVNTWRGAKHQGGAENDNDGKHTRAGRRCEMRGELDNKRNQETELKKIKDETYLHSNFIPRAIFRSDEHSWKEACHMILDTWKNKVLSDVTATSRWLMLG